jgi:1-acyl-sn-glycerol-3-phosphate acyltransferase
MKPPFLHPENKPQIGQGSGDILPKPRARKIRPWLTRLPPHTPLRRAFRNILKWGARLLLILLARVEVQGLANIPAHGALILVSNHLGDADAVVGLAYLPRSADPLVKSEVYDFPLLGWLFEAYGVIWIHRGQPDRKAIRTALEGLEMGRAIAIAPEGRESVTGGLEEGMGGAAFLAMKSGAPVLPFTLTGTENKNILGSLKRFRRPSISLTIGHSFHLEQAEDRHVAIEKGTELIMRALASQLPDRYQGIYRTGEEK